MISNSLTNLLDQKLQTLEDVDQFIDNLEDEIFGISNREFYLKFKGDIKELNQTSANFSDQLRFESELLTSLLVYVKQRKLINTSE